MAATVSAEPNFDSVARIYRWCEYLSLGPLLQRMREHYLPELARCRCALVLGDGDGRFLAKLMRQNLDLRALAVDTSAAMLRLLKQRCAAAAGGCDRLRVLHGSALAVQPPDGVDLVVTHFFLDCLTQAEVNELTQRIAQFVQPGTLWVVSDFGVPRAHLLRPVAALYVRALYFAFGLLTGLRVTRLPDSQQAFAAAGFVRCARKERLGGLLYTELWQRR